MRVETVASLFDLKSANVPDSLNYLDEAAASSAYHSRTLTLDEWLLVCNFYLKSRIFSNNSLRLDHLLLTVLTGGLTSSSL
jgi:hypothetical protein